MADLSDPKIDQDIFRLIYYCSRLSMIDPDNHLKAYQDVRSDKSDTNWLLLDYISDRSDKLQVTRTGTGGLAELCEVLDDTKASYAYARVTYSNDKESTREKFILVISVQAADVKKVLRVYSIEVAAEVKDDLKEDPIVAKLRKSEANGFAAGDPRGSGERDQGVCIWSLEEVLVKLYKIEKEITSEHDGENLQVLG
ncbi:hypothetical protein C0995_003132 [Termitomyces sp. Mi166|nr:hypothetical protein C0995_003132 [Termitomyces sp. Mi166\